jgi:quercetin dioxygenase-like cupin family protein
MRIGTFVSLAASIVAGAALFTSGSMYADDAHNGLKVTPLIQQAFPDLPGKEGLVLMVEFAPGHVDMPHRHDAHVFVYVLEGSIEMQVAGGKPAILNPGDTFYENPQDVHPVGRNMSKTKPARFLVFFVKNENTPPVLPATTN